MAADDILKAIGRTATERIFRAGTEAVEQMTAAGMDEEEAAAVIWPLIQRINGTYRRAQTGAIIEGGTLADIDLLWEEDTDANG
jgi:hypothetical protein